jgi:hypothetical protein
MPGVDMKSDGGYVILPERAGVSLCLPDPPPCRSDQQARAACLPGAAVDKSCHPIQDQIKAKLEVVLKIGLRIGWRRLKDPGLYRSSQHWKSALVNQPSEELTVRQRQPKRRIGTF